MIYFDEEDSLYCYEGSQVLKNKYGITDPDELEEIEKEITSTKISELKASCPMKNKFNFEYYKKIHYFLFEELYEWAGQIRKVRIKKGGFPFAYPKNIEREGERIFSELKNENQLKEYTFEKFIKRMAYFMTELNALHPFREGNGRVNRIFFRDLAEEKGYDLNFEAIEKEKYLQAIIKATVESNDDLLVNVLKTCIKWLIKRVWLKRTEMIPWKHLNSPIKNRKRQSPFHRRWNVVNVK